MYDHLLSGDTFASKNGSSSKYNKISISYTVSKNDSSQ